jgi:hypothetical protein
MNTPGWRFACEKVAGPRVNLEPRFLGDLCVQSADPARLQVTSAFLDEAVPGVDYPVAVRYSGLLPVSLPDAESTQSRSGGVSICLLRLDSPPGDVQRAHPRELTVIE